MQRNNHIVDLAAVVGVIQAGPKKTDVIPKGAAQGKGDVQASSHGNAGVASLAKTKRSGTWDATEKTIKAKIFF